MEEVWIRNYPVPILGSELIPELILIPETTSILESNPILKSIMKSIMILEFMPIPE